jgi:hypothetical protein
MEYGNAEDMDADGFSNMYDPANCKEFSAKLFRTECHMYVRHLALTPVM